MASAGEAAKLKELQEEAAALKRKERDAHLTPMWRGIKRKCSALNSDSKMLAHKKSTKKRKYRSRGLL